MNANYDFSQAFNGSRLTRMYRASVQSNGRLNLPPDASRAMGIDTTKALLICPMGDKDLAVTVIEKGDERGFEIHKTGPYFYVPFKSLLTELGIDFRNNTVVYDIIETADRYEGSPVYKFNRRIIRHVAEVSKEGEGVSQGADEADNGAEGDGAPGETAAVHGEDAEGTGGADGDGGGVH